MNSLLDSVFNNDENNSGNLIVSANGALTEQASTTKLLNDSGLNWQVEKVKLLTPEGKESGFFATRHSETKICFAPFTDAYNVFQNLELAELVQALAQEFGYKLHNGGSLNGGRKVYLQLEQEEIKNFGINNDRLKNYVTALNTHDGSRSVAFGSTNITVSCQNTFFAAYKGLQNKVRHTESMRDRIQDAIKAIKGLQEQERSMFETFFSWVNKPVQPEQIKSVISSVMEIDISKSKQELQKELSTKALNQVQEVLASISGEMKEKGQNFWGLFSGFTHYTTHKQSAPNRVNGRFESKLFGRAQEIDAKAFKVIATL